jgi:hypothetical protein
VQLGVTGSLDLIQQQIDSRLTLSGPPQADNPSGRPDIFVGLNGPVATPHRTIDVSALTGWLTIRGINQQAKKLEALEAAARAQEAARAKEQATPSAPAPVAPPPAAVAPADVPQTKPATRATPTPERAAPLLRTAPAASTQDPAAPTQDHGVPRIVVPERGSSAAIVRRSAIGAGLSVPATPKSTQAPPLPAPLQVRRIPRGPDRAQESEEPETAGRQNEPLRLPSALPSWLDNLVGSQR